MAATSTSLRDLTSLNQLIIHHNLLGVENISLDELDLGALTYLGSRPAMLRGLELLGTFDIHQSLLTTGHRVRSNKEVKAAGDNAKDALIDTFIA